MSLAKFMKGCTTIRELEDMPVAYSHTIYKEYVTTLKDREKSEAAANEEALEEFQDQMNPL